MRFDQRVLIPAPVDQVWAVVRDIPVAAACVPGTRDVRLARDGRSEGSTRVKIGPITVELEGAMTLRDESEEERPQGAFGDEFDTTNAAVRSIRLRYQYSTQ